MIEFTALDAITEMAAGLPKADDTAIAAAQDRQNQLTKPPGSLGRLEEIALFIAGWQGREKPAIETAQALVFAGNHGICDQGVNPFPQAVTAQMVANFEAGGAAINQLCRANGATLDVIALDLDRPTQDFTLAPAMTETETLDAMSKGAAAVSPDADILLLGEMGIGNSTIAAALAAACIGGAPETWVGAGTGSDADGIALKAKVIADGLAKHGSRAPMHALAIFGGREQAAICGAVLAARAARMPVLLDGYICTAAVAPLFATDPTFLDHCLIGHASAEPGHAKLVQAMGKAPVLDFEMRLGEGTGAALALGIVRPTHPLPRMWPCRCDR
ncbi:MAG: nicotinate-nucleotide--dimethylbenzimidazole phosphoribosyltransferase, partial [Pseudomonadota bacterium]